MNNAKGYQNRDKVGMFDQQRKKRREKADMRRLVLQGISSKMALEQVKIAITPHFV